MDALVVRIEKNVTLQGSLPIPFLGNQPLVVGMNEHIERYSSVDLTWKVKAQIVEHERCEIHLGCVRTGIGVDIGAGDEGQNVACFGLS